MLEDHIGYIRIDQFDRHCLENVEKAIESLKQGGALKALIVDVRLNPGGLLDQAVGVSDLFLSEGVIVRLQSRLKEEEVVFKADAQTGIPADMPVVVLTDFGSASAAEVFAGALQAHHRAVILGTKTFGKGAVNRIYPLADGSGVVLTIAHYSVDKDKTIEGKGIEPDVKVGELAPLPPAADEKELGKWQTSFWAAHEEQLKRAVELLKEKVR
jgi:carboxyl-terminal processing protease